MRLGFKSCIFICVGAILLMSQNTFAAFDISEKVTLRNYLPTGSLYWQDSNEPSTWRTTTFKNYGRNNTHSSAVYFRFSNSNRTLHVEAGDYVVISGSFYATSAVGGASNTVGSIYIGSEALNCPITSLDIDNVSIDNISAQQQLTYHSNFTILCRETTNISNQLAVNLRLETLSQYTGDYAGISFDSMYVFYADNSISDILEYLENHPDNASDTLQQEKQDVQNAADNSETVADNNSENTATTNLVGALSSLLSALTNLNATNCNVTLPFPSALGGNMTVNICQNKDYAGNIISVFGSLTLCVFYVPLALKLLSMIYNEIRSFTNG